MAIKNYNVNPYYDDFDQNKNFYRILFKPGVAVQARELTQLQTILQNQIAQFGSHVFEEGSIVIPGQSAINNRYQYVKLQDSYNDVSADTILSSLVGKTIVGQTSLIRAEVINFKTSENGDPPTIFVKYTKSGLNDQSTFADDEVITDEVSLRVKSAATNATGSGSAFVIEAGVLFTKGTFVSFEKQTQILSKYSAATNIVVGFEVTESTITSQQDNTLLDPAQGSYNYAAPGADRYQIDLEIKTRANSTAEDENFIQLLRVEDGQISFQANRPEYAYLEDTLARRTFDESGNYVVKPYGLALNEHLKNDVFENGLFTSAQGGDESLLLARISPGKSYVRGYEVENLVTRNIEINKGRDTKELNSAFVRTNRPNHIVVTNLHNVPNFDELVQVSLYDTFTVTPGSTSGTVVGTARVRGLEYKSGTHGTDAEYYMYLFDVQMADGKTFERNVKQITDGTFTCDVQPAEVQLTGSISGTSGSAIVVGNGTRFTEELQVGDSISALGQTQRYTINSITNDNEFVVTANLSADIDNTLYTRLDTQTVSGNPSYIYRFSHDAIQTHSDEVYFSRRLYERTLSGGSVSITANVDEVFTSHSSENYFLVVQSGGSAGTVIDLSSKIVLSGSPSGKVITIDVSGDGLTGEDVAIFTTVAKTNSASSEKVKTLQEDEVITKLTEAGATATKILLNKADVYRIKSIETCDANFGDAFDTATAVDITNNYTFNNGQTPYFYGIGFIKRKASATPPTGPIRITFDYFTHSPGDYFSVNSYEDIEYYEIPNVSVGGQSYNLARCLDFRPRINDAGTGFTGTGASLTEILDFNNDVQMDYSYFLGRIDKLFINSEGEILVKKGEAADTPIEPAVPTNGMGIFTLKIPPYTYSVSDVSITTIDNKRYTMRDIGAFDSRIRNLEYYTTLSLLEKETANLQFKDELGFERFKNGFIVDSFTGHKVGDPTRADYNVAMDKTKKELLPITYSTPIPFKEENVLTSERTADGYQKTGKFATLPYAEAPFITVDKASRTENVNPYDVITYEGRVRLTPNKDVWFNTQELGGVVQLDEPLDYASLLDSSLVEDPFNSLFGYWRENWFGDLVNQNINPSQLNVDGTVNTLGVVDNGLSENEKLFLRNSVAERPDITIDGDVARTNVIAPFMRSKAVLFSASGLRPNTRVYPFFDGFRVDTMCTTTNQSIIDAVGEEAQFDTAFNNALGPLITDESGNIEGIFYYDAQSLRLQTGTKTFKLSDSTINDDNEATTFAQTSFFSTGEYIVQAEIDVPPRDFEADVLGIIADQPAALPNPGADVESDGNLGSSSLSYTVTASANMNVGQTWGSVNLTSLGTGYQVGDIVQHVGGTLVDGRQPRTFKITSVLSNGEVNGVEVVHAGCYVAGSLPSAGTYTGGSASEQAVYDSAEYRDSCTYPGDNVDFSYKNIQFLNTGGSGSVLIINTDVTSDASSDIDLDFIFPDNSPLTIGSGQSGHFGLGVRKHTVGTETFNLYVPTNESTGTRTFTITVEGVSAGGDEDAYVEPDAPASWVGVQGNQAGLIASVINHIFGRNPRPREIIAGLQICEGHGLTLTTINNATVDVASSWQNVDISSANAAALSLFDVVHGIITDAHEFDPEGGHWTLPSFVSTYPNYSDRIYACALTYTYHLITHDGTTSAPNHNWPLAVKSLSLDTYVGELLGANALQCPNLQFGENGSYVDPLAQTFLISAPVHLTSVDLFFRTKSETFPVEVQLRRVVNGFPASTGFVEGTSVMLQPNQVSLSSDGSVATRFTFDHPVYLESDEYALVVLSPNTTEYNVFISQVGQNDLITGNLIEEQPSLGVLFKSQNARTWTPDQSQDLKMRINRAQFETGTGLINFVPNMNEYGSRAKLDVDPFEVFDGSSTMKVYHKNHGLSNGSSVYFSGLPNLPSDGKYFNIDPDDINYVAFGDDAGTKYTVANATLDTYTVTLSTNAIVATDKARFGGSNVFGTRSVQFDVLYLQNLILNNNEENVTYRIKTTNTGYSTDSSFSVISDISNDITFAQTRQLADELNQTDKLSGNPAFIYQVEITSDNDRISPLVSLEEDETIGIFSRYRINSPVIQDALTEENITIADSNQITFESDGKISFANAGDQTLVSRAIEGTQIEVSYASGELNPDNEGTYRIREVAEDGSYIYVSSSLTAQSAGPDVTITNQSGFVFEEAPQGGSTYSKYITRKIDFVNPSTSLVLRILTSKPAGTDIEFYYKTQLVSDTLAIEDKEFIEMNIDVPTSLSNGYIDIEHELNDLPEFNSIVFKIVFKGADGGNTAIIPKCKDLRLLALA